MTMDEAALKAAADDAIKEDDNESIVEEEEAATDDIQEVDEEEIEEAEVDEEELPTDHNERSKLGRKISTLFTHKDAQDKILLNILDGMEELKGNMSSQNEEYDDEYIKRSDLEKIQTQKNEKDIKYDNAFKQTYWDLVKSLDIPKEEEVEIGKILIQDFNIKDTGNGVIDGSRAFVKAREEYLNKKTPLQNNKASGVATKQTVKSRKPALVKLDSASKAYIERIRKQKGPEAALKLHQSLSKEA